MNLLFKMISRIARGSARSGRVDSGCQWMAVVFEHDVARGETGGVQGAGRRRTRGGANYTKMSYTTKREKRMDSLFFSCFGCIPLCFESSPYHAADSRR